eukprot:COSAG02_NODE_21672_length_779_cov_1.029412_1_plen_169_part_10
MALRISCSNTSASPPVADWPHAPPAAHGIVQLEGGRSGDDSGAWLLSETALFFVSVPAMSKPQTTDEFRVAAMPTFHRVELPAGLIVRHLVVSEDGELLGVIGQDHDDGWKIAWTDCQSASRCKVDDTANLPYETVKDVACGGKHLYIATSLGLYRADTTLRKLEASPI